MKKYNMLKIWRLLCLLGGVLSSGLYGLTIEKAYWGDLNRSSEEKRWDEVSYQLQKLVSGTGLEIAAGWDPKVKALGDPAYGVSKGLVILAKDKDGDYYLFRGNEADSVSFPGSFTKIEIRDEDNKQPFDLEVAWYGNLNAQVGSNEVVDVTDKTGATNQGLLIPAGVSKNDIFGIDPKVGWQKGLLLVFFENGQLKIDLSTETARVEHGDIIALQRAQEGKAPLLDGTLKILAAYWGDLNRPEVEAKRKNVTKDVSRLVQGGNLDIAAGYQAKIGFMGDPVQGVSKGLLIAADYNGELYLGRFNEQDQISFPYGFARVVVPSDPIQTGGLHILKAFFGNLNAQAASVDEIADVTRESRAYIESDSKGNDRLHIIGKRNKLDLFNIPDPKFGWDKGYCVLYLHNKRIHMHLAGQDAEVTLPDAFEALEKNPRKATVVKEAPNEIKILLALMGDVNRPKKEGRWGDVTDIIQLQVIGDKLEIPSSPKDLKMLAEEIGKGAAIGAGTGAAIGGSVGVGVGGGVAAGFGAAIAGILAGFTTVGTASVPAAILGGTLGFAAGGAVGGVVGGAVGTAVGGTIGTVAGTIAGIEKLLGETAVLIIAQYQGDIYFGLTNCTEPVSFPDTFTKLELPEAPAKDTLYILSAGFGNLVAWQDKQDTEILDVTDQLADMVKNDYLKLQGGVSKVQIFGSDPMPNWFKGFYVAYWFNGLYFHLGSEVSEVKIPSLADLILPSKKVQEIRVKEEALPETKEEIIEPEEEEEAEEPVIVPVVEKEIAVEPVIEKKEVKEVKTQKKKKAKKKAKKKVKKKKAKKKAAKTVGKKKKKLVTTKGIRKKDAKKKVRRRMKKRVKKTKKKNELKDVIDDVVDEL